MSKYKKQNEEKPEILKKIFSHKELEKLDRGLKKYGHEKFLIRTGAIRVDDKGSWIVRMYPGLALEMIKTGMGQSEYDTDIPYIYWQEAIEQLNIKISREKFAEKKKLEGLEKLTDGMTIPF